MTPTAIKHGRCLFSNLKISEKKSVKNRKLLKKLAVKGNPLRMIQAKFGLNWPSGFRGEDFLKSLQTDAK
jgi:hypothetical protein